jgi:hypothetical protein
VFVIEKNDLKHTVFFPARTHVNTGRIGPPVSTFALTSAKPKSGSQASSLRPMTILSEGNIQQM